MNLAAVHADFSPMSFQTRERVVPPLASPRRGGRASAMTLPFVNSRGLVENVSKVALPPSSYRRCGAGEKALSAEAAPTQGWQTLLPTMWQFYHHQRLEHLILSRANCFESGRVRGLKRGCAMDRCLPPPWGKGVRNRACCSPTRCQPTRPYFIRRAWC